MTDDDHRHSANESADYQVQRRWVLRAATAAVGTGLFSTSGTAGPYGGSRHVVPGRIEAEDFDTDGAGIAYHDTTAGNEGDAYRDEDVDIQSGGDNYNVGWTAAGEWLNYAATIETAGTYEVTARTASNAGGGTFILEQDQEPVATFDVPDTGGWQSWQTVTRQVDLESGDHTIAIAFDTAGINVDWLDFSLAGGGDDDGGEDGNGGDGDDGTGVADDYPNLDGNAWDLAWNDEFDEGAIDTAVWTFATGGGCGENGRLETDCTWGNQEEQYYTDGDNASIENERLVIEAREERAPNGQNPYTSARLKTAGSFETQNGRIEVRARLPETQGLWPAIWMLGHDIDEVGWPQCGEIDIMELLGHDPTTVHGTVHGPGYFGSGGIGNAHSGPDFSAGFHDFQITWYPDTIKWFVDGTHYHTVTREEVEAAGNQWVFQDEFFILLNVAVGGEFPGYPDSTTELPQRMEVEYVRVFDSA